MAETPTNQISLQEFLQDAPPNAERAVSRFRVSLSQGWGFAKPDLQLFCAQVDCQRVQFFTSIDEGHVRISSRDDGLLHYVCRNCFKTTKTFGIRVKQQSGFDGVLAKIGESPSFGPALPARLQRLVQPDRTFLIKGFQSENKGFGIGAFAYYRRVVEDEKDRLIDEIIKVCKQTPGADKFVSGLEAAKKQIQFKKAVEEIADAIPDVLRIDGHNPLTLLHQALSKSLHAESDEQCLEAAHAIRVVLAALAERMSQLLKEDDELTKAVGKLLGSRSAKTTANNTDP